jgi:hypothetical protein
MLNNIIKLVKLWYITKLTGFVSYIIIIEIALLTSNPSIVGILN